MYELRIDCATAETEAVRAMEKSGDHIPHSWGKTYFKGLRMCRGELWCPVRCRAPVCFIRTIVTTRAEGKEMSMRDGTVS